MKRKLFIFLLALVALATTRTWAAEPYAVYAEDNSSGTRVFKLTFYYDNNKSSHQATVGEITFALNTGSNKPDWIENRNSYNPNDIREVVFDATFANYRPTTMSHWFDHMYGVQTITGLSNLNTSSVTNMSYMFWCSMLNTIDLSSLDVSNVTDMSYMFGGSSRLTSLNISGWNPSNVTDMSYMFEDCSGLTTLNLSGWNPSKVTDMNHMFYGCDGLMSISFGSQWTTPKVANMSYMFSGCTSLTTLNMSGWNVSAVTDMSYMFNGCTGLATLNLNGWNVSAVTDMSYMFKGCTGLTTLYVGNWNPSSAIYMQCMFYDCEKLQSIDMGNWNTGNATKMNSMFYGCTQLQAITFGSSWNTANVTDMSSMFYDCSSLSSNYLNISSWNTASVTSMSSMFAGCSSLTSLSLSNWNTGNVTKMNSMFYGCTQLQTITFGSNWNTGSVTSMSSMFSGCSSLTSLNLSNWNTDNVSDMSNMFYDCSSLSTLTGIGSRNTGSVTTMKDMFHGCSNLTSLNLNGWNTGSVTTMNSMFSGCSKLATLNLSGWNNQELTDLKDMFKDCTALATLNLNGWKVPKLTSVNGWFEDCSALTTFSLNNFDAPALTNMQYVFRNCSSLTAIDMSSWNTPNVTNISGMFAGCSSLSTLNMNGWSTENVTSMYSLFYGCSALQTLDLSSWNTANVTTMGGMFTNCTRLSTLNLSGWNTANVSSMSSMFSGCQMLSTLDLSSFNTANVTYMGSMFQSCNNLMTIYVGAGWTTTAVTSSSDMFTNCLNLVGGMGTAYSEWHKDKSYARIDSPNSHGYLSSIPYVIYADGTLTFYCDGNRDEHADEELYYLNTGLNVPGWTGRYADVTTVVFDASFENIRPTSTYGWFASMSHLTEIVGLEHLYTDCVTNMLGMFTNCQALTALNLNNFNTANVTNMESLFEGCSGLQSLSLGSFNTGKVTTMARMFYGCSALTTICVDEGWTTANVTASSNMFTGCNSLVGGAGTAYSSSNPTDKTYARIDGAGTPGYFCDQSLFDVYVSFEPATGTLTFRSDARRSSFGDNAFDLNADGENPGWYANRKAVANVVFDPTFNDVRPTSAYSWFRGMSNLTSISGIENLHTDDITNMESMFASCSKLTELDLSGFNTAAVTNMENMFNGCTQLTTIHAGLGWDTDNVTSSLDMFEGCTQLIGGNGTVYDENHTDKEYACLNGSSAIPSYLTVDLPLEPYAVFADGILTFRYDGLKQLPAVAGTTVYDLNSGNDAPGWQDVSSTVTAVVFEPSFAEARPTSTYSWFNSMSALEDISGLQYLNTSQATTMASMFQACSGLTTLDLGSFATANVSDMSNMFSGCSNLTTIYVGTGWSTASVTDATDMFVGCTQLAGAAGTQFNPDATGAERAVVDGIDDGTGYLSYLAYATVTHAYTSSGVSDYLTFFYDGLHAQRMLTEPVYTLNTGTEEPAWTARAASFEGVTFDTSFRSVRPTSTYRWFYGMTGLTSFSSYNLNTSEVTTMSGMFQGCTALETFVATDWDTGKVTNMSNMFNGCSALTNANLNTFNTVRVTDMSGMFQGCTALTALSLDAFSTGSVTNMSNMFNGCSALTTISVANGWNTNSVNSSSNMFLGCNSIKGSEGTTYNASYTDKTRARVDGGTSSPGYLSYLVAAPYAAYDDATSTLTFYCDRWRSTHAETFSLGEYPEWSSKSIIHVVFDPSFDAARPTNTYQWFYGQINLEDITGIEYLHTDNVTSMVNMFWNCQKLTDLDVSQFNTTSVTAMAGMFMYCKALTTLDLSNWDTHNVLSMYEMFRESTALTTIYVGDGWNTDNVTSSSSMFYGCTSLRGGSYTYYNNNNPDDKTYARLDGGTSSPGYFSNKPKAYAYLGEGDNTLYFYYDGDYNRRTGSGAVYDIDATGTDAPAWAVRSADIQRVRFEYSFKNARPTTTYMWFANMTNLVDITGMEENLVTDSVTNMSHMFSGCSSLAEINTSMFNTQLVADMSYMFAGCTALTTSNLSSFVVPQVTNMTGMFQGCSNLTTINVRNDWNPAGVLPATSSGMFDGCTRLLGAGGTTYDASHTDKEYARLDNPDLSKPGYLTRLQEAYANLQGSTLVFYCDDQRALRDGATYSMNTGGNEPDWNSGTYITHVEFDASFDIARPTSTAYWFSYKEYLEDITGLEYLHTDNVTYMDNMFEYCTKLTSLDLSGWNTGKVTSMLRMFYGCSNLEDIELSNWDTHNVTNMCYMFSRCSKLGSLNLSNWDTQNLEATATMFRECTGLTDLDLSGWNTESLQDVSSMFYGCTALTAIYAGNWNKENISSHNTFSGCTNLVGGAGTAYSGYEASEAAYDHIDGGTANPGFFTDPALREAYAYFSAADSTLTFCYDAKMTVRQNEGKTVFTNVLNTGTSYPGWYGNRAAIAHVEFGCSFASARPTSTHNWFEGMTNLIDITGLEYLNTSEVTYMVRMFYKCSALTSLDVSHFDTQKVTSMVNMFYNCNKLKLLDVSGFNTNKVMNMSFMFYGCSGLTSLDVSGFNTDKVTNMSYMFYDCSSLTSLDVSRFNTSNVTNMGCMFYNCQALTALDVSGFNTANVTSMASMFYNCQALTALDVSGFNTAKVTNMQAMFSSCQSLTSLDVSGFNTANVTNMLYMFNNCTGLSSLDLSNFDTSKVTNFGSMFGGCSGLTSLDLSSFDTSNVTNISSMFSGCSELTCVDLSSFDTRNVTSMLSLFFGCNKLTELDLSSFNTAKVTDFRYTFYQCKALKTIYVGSEWNTDAATDSGSMFYMCNSLVGGAGTTYKDLNPADKTYAHIDGGTDDPGYLTLGIREAYAVLSTDGTTLTFYYDVKKDQRGGMSLNTGTNNPAWYNNRATVTSVTFTPSFANARPTSTYRWFFGMGALNHIEGIENLNTSEVTTMAFMFSNCQLLTSIDVTGFDTQKVTNMGCMFQYCSALSDLDVSGFNTQNVMSMAYMFFCCNSLTNINVTSFNTQNVVYMGYMFSGCSRLTSLDVTGFNTAAVTDMAYMFSNCSGLTSLDVSGFNTQNVKSMAYMFQNCSGLTSLDVSGFNTQNVTNMQYMFYSCSGLTSLDMSGFNTAAVTDMMWMFSNCSGLTSLDVSGFNTAKVTNISFMFNNCTGLTSLDLSGFNTESLLYMSSTFKSCSNITSLDLSGFNTQNVTGMRELVSSCSKLTSIDLSSFNTANVTDMYQMFYNCSALTTIYAGSGWTTDAVTSSTSMFYNCTHLVGGAGTTYNSSNPADKTYAHIDGGTDNPGYFTDPDAFIVGDVNKDGAITIADVTALVNIILGKTPASTEMCNTSVSYRVTKDASGSYGEQTMTLTGQALQAVKTALQLTTTELATKMVRNSATPLANGEARFMPVDADGNLVLVSQTDNDYGYWFNDEGETVAWGNDAKVVVRLTFEDGDIKIMTCQFPSHNQTGDEFPIRMALVYKDETGKQGATYFTFNFVFDNAGEYTTTLQSVVTPVPEAIDVNGDGAITIADVTALVNIILGKN